MFQSYLRSLIFTTLVTIPYLVNAGPAERAARVAPYVDEQAIAILYLDASRFESTTTFEQLGKLAPNDRVRGQMARTAKLLEQPLEVLKQAKADVYVIFSLADLPRLGPSLIVASQPNSDKPAIIAALAGLKAAVCEPIDDVVFCGSKEAFDRIKSARFAARPDVARAFTAGSGAPLQLLVVLSADHRRALAEMLPRLPDAFGGGSGRAIADIEWAAAQIRFSPTLSVNVTTQSPTDESALALKSTLTSLFFALGQNENVRKNVPKIDQLLAAIVPQSEGRQLKLNISAEGGNLETLLAAIAAPVGQAQASAQRQLCTVNLKNLALGMHIYHDKHKQFPSAASHDQNGKPLLSWRVHLLPYLNLDQQKLYEQFHLDEPWDSEHNKQLISQMPDVFACPSADLRAAGKTTYLLPTGPNAVFQVSEGVRFRDIADGLSNTVMIVDAAPARAVDWTKPQDIEIDQKRPLDGLGGQHEKTFAAAFCDGSVHQLPTDIALQTLRWLLDPKDGNPIPPPF